MLNFVVFILCTVAATLSAYKGNHGIVIMNAIFAVLNFVCWRL